MQGIYEIYCSRTGKRYIGSSKDIDRRWKSHLSSLKQGKHHNYRLQKTYSIYGEDNLVFSVLEIVKNEKDLYMVEERYIKRYKFSKLFNAMRKPGAVPRKKSRWMNYCEQDKNKKKKEVKESEYVWGEE